MPLLSSHIQRRPSSDPPRFGDLVEDGHGYFGVVIGVEGDSPSGLDVVLLLGNGLKVERHWRHCTPQKLPSGRAIQNFAEALRQPSELVMSIGVAIPNCKPKGDSSNG